MDLKVTITKTLKDVDWGFSDLIGERSLNDETVKRELLDLLWEDIFEVTNKAIFKFEEIKSNEL